jgi:hypothetical protein
MVRRSSHSYSQSQSQSPSPLPSSSSPSSSKKTQNKSQKEEKKRRSTTPPPTATKKKQQKTTRRSSTSIPPPSSIPQSSLSRLPSPPSSTNTSPIIIRNQPKRQSRHEPTTPEKNQSQNQLEHNIPSPPTIRRHSTRESSTLAQTRIAALAQSPKQKRKLYQQEEEGNQGNYDEYDEQERKYETSPPSSNKRRRVSDTPQRQYQHRGSQKPKRGSGGSSMGGSLGNLSLSSHSGRVSATTRESSVKYPRVSRADQDNLDRMANYFDDLDATPINQIYKIIKSKSDLIDQNNRRRMSRRERDQEGYFLL